MDPSNSLEAAGALPSLRDEFLYLEETSGSHSSCAGRIRSCTSCYAIQEFRWDWAVCPIESNHGLVMCLTVSLSNYNLSIVGMLNFLRK